MSWSASWDGQGASRARENIHSGDVRTEAREPYVEMLAHTEETLVVCCDSLCAR